MPSREKIDIEALLIRAYYEKAIHRLGDVGAVALGLSGPKGAGGGYSTDDKVDTSSFSSRVAAQVREMQARLANAPSGLLDLHDVVLSLEDFYVEHVTGLDCRVWDADTAERLGHRIDTVDGASTIVRVERRGGVGAGREDLLPAGPARRLTRIVTSTLLIQHGRAADRPFVPAVEIARMRPIYEGARKEAVGYEPVYVTPLHAVVEGRASYAVWHAACGILREIFAGSSEYEVTGPAASPAPWLDEPRVLPGLIAWNDGLKDEEPEEAAPSPGKRRPRKVRSSGNSQAKSKACAA
ncbi:hypothetical protein [Methylobacterium gnaphalii]|uniref:Uncharacterized protein n=1 Tax=Methylobacterium gnaphalii TaxID=1010610 RepID=A0A512JPC5_9HYPH|nr:hypothetical protein [Methylobacterium gnaphalii]GEP11806.1 hypothetical protein MGN01_36510 [Methylobacterium gnaphalii]GJD69483.1 hypothetical protein MMMDOFMJ_2414 [Methylobacterium gnaphalii]GLS49559.1 hypothetical protein GCM10007885_24080 [Methylobacterium gnaphalii]